MTGKAQEDSGFTEIKRGKGRKGKRKRTACEGTGETEGEKEKEREQEQEKEKSIGRKRKKAPIKNIQERTVQNSNKKKYWQQQTSTMNADGRKNNKNKNCAVRLSPLCYSVIFKIHKFLSIFLCSICLIKTINPLPITIIGPPQIPIEN